MHEINKFLVQFLHDKFWIFAGTRVAVFQFVFETFFVFQPTGNMIKIESNCIRIDFVFTVFWHPVKKKYYYFQYELFHHCGEKVDANIFQCNRKTVNCYGTKWNINKWNKQKKKVKEKKYGISGCCSMFVDKNTHTRFANLPTATTKTLKAQ